METSLHRQLKELYASDSGQIEAPLGRYRIDVVRDGKLIEIQHGSLAAIRDKIQCLLRKHHVIVVKPIVVRKQLVKQDGRNGTVRERRLSPKRGTILDLFDDLVYFTRVFPHPNLTLDAPLLDVEEWRFPGHGRRRRRRAKDHQVEDQKLIAVRETRRFRTAGDLLELIPTDLPDSFDTADLATSLGVQRWTAQRIAFCLRKMKAVQEIGKQGNARLYRRSA